MVCGCILYLMISISGLTKIYRVPDKKDGIFPALLHVVRPKYRSITALDHIDAEIEKGEIVGYIGENGAGKTTTMKLLSGLLTPTSGTVNVLGYTPSERDFKYLKQIGFVMGQKNQLWWDLPVIESFKLQKEIYEIPDRKFHSALNELVDLLEVKTLLHQPVRNLSLGQRMKCELINVLIYRPSVLFLDEPTIGLDVITQAKVRNFLKEYNQKYKATIILTSHSMDDIEDLCSRVILINRGKKMYDGSISQLIQKHIPHKTITLQLASKRGVDSLSSLPCPHDLQYPTLVVKSSRDQTTEIVRQLLSLCDITDMDIKEPSLEDVVRTL